MKKSDLIEAVAEKHNLSEKVAMQIVDLVFNGFTDALRKDGRIEIRDFGRFSVREYDPYAGRNPKTGEPIKVKRKKLPYFKAGRELRDKVNHK